MMEETIKKLRGNIQFDQILLKNFINLTAEEKECVRRWRNHLEVRKWMYNDHEIRPEEHEAFIKSLKDSRKDFYYLVFHEEKPIGVLTFTRLDLRNRNAYFGLYANPEEKVPGAGLILEKTAIRLAFEILKLHTLKLEVIEDNLRAINLYRSAGFKEEGRLKEFVFKDGTWKDVIVMGMINPYEKP